MRFRTRGRGGGGGLGVNPTLALDFLNNSYSLSGVGTYSSFSDFITGASATFTRASVAQSFASSGLLTEAASGAARLDFDPTTLQARGLLVEPARTNVVLHNRDLTNAAWTKSNITAAKDQVGVDGVANSASSITATSGNGTCLQSITLGSSARFQTAYVKRITGSGTINMTMDNGTTWTAVTVTSSWTRVQIPTQTITNPTVGFRIVTSGDAIAVDLVQNENGSYATSPTITGAASFARSADVFALGNGASWLNTSEGTFVAEHSVPTTIPASGTIDYAGPQIRQVGNSANTIRSRIFDTAGGRISDAVVISASSTLLDGLDASIAFGVAARRAIAYKASDYANAINGAAPQTTSIAVPSSLGELSITGVFGHIRRIFYYPTRLTNAQVQALSL